ncbi:MAG: DNA repair exonuclease [Akkermansiaceae bacterium]
MPLRILHTADNHIGLSFSRYPDGVRDRLLEERFSALERLVATANARQAHFFVVAGDLFDKVNVPKSVVERTVKILREFNGEAVLVLAGNHDYCEGPDSKLWKWFRTAADGSSVIALTDQETKEFRGDDYQVRFYACPCPSKHAKDHVIGWVADEEKSPDMLHIGIAHGNVEGLGLDADQRYFNMSEGDFRKAGLHTWLLGHIHVPSPAPGITGRPLYFMPGIHTPDSVKCSHPGHAWWIELEPDGSSRHEQLTSGAIRIVRLTRSLNHASDIAALQANCAALDAPNTVLDFQLTGRLHAQELAELHLALDALQPSFLHLSREQDIAQALDAAAIAKRFPEGTLPNDLLQALLADQELHPGDAHLALELIESLQTS